MKNSTIRKLSYALGAIIAVAAAAILTVILLKSYGTPIKQTATVESVSLPSLGDALKLSLKDTTNVTVLTNIANSSAPLASPIGNQNWVTVDNGSAVLEVSATSGSKDANDGDNTKAIEALKEKGLQEQVITIVPSSDDSVSRSTVRYFASKDFACNVSNTFEVDKYSLRVSCANKTSFSKNTQAVKPFADAYSDSSKGARNDVVFGTPSIQNSATKNYKNASLGYSEINTNNPSSVATFYQTPDSKWHFFTVAASIDKVSCSDYKTTDLTDAFLGFSCWDATANASSFVKTAAPTFEIVPGAQG